MGAAQRSAGGSAAQQSCPWVPLLVVTFASCVHGCQTPAADPSEIATLAAEYLTLPTTRDIGQDGAWSCCTVGPQEVFQECADEGTVWMVTSSMTCSGDCFAATMQEGNHFDTPQHYSTRFTFVESEGGHRVLGMYERAAGAAGRNQALFCGTAQVGTGTTGMSGMDNLHTELGQCVAAECGKSLLPPNLRCLPYLR